MSLQTALAKPPCGPEFMLSGTRVAMVNPVLSYTKASAAPLTIQKIIPATCQQFPSQQRQNSIRLACFEGLGNVQINGNSNEKAGAVHMDKLLHSTNLNRPASKSSAKQLYQSSKQNSFPVHSSLTQNIRKLSIHSEPHSGKQRTFECAKNMPVASKWPNLSPEVTALSLCQNTHLPTKDCVLPNHANTSLHLKIDVDVNCSNTDGIPSVNSETDGTSSLNMRSGVSVKDIWETMKKESDVDYTSDMEEEPLPGEEISEGSSTKLHISKPKKKKLRWKSGRKSRMKHHRLKKSAVRTPSIIGPTPLLAVPATSPTSKLSQEIQPLQARVVTKSMRTNQTVSTGIFFAQKHVPVLNNGPMFTVKSDPGSLITPRTSFQFTKRSTDAQPLQERLTKVFLSQPQASILHELGMDLPSAPPATPMPEQLRTYEYIPCMYDIMAQRSLKTQLEAMVAKEMKKKEKVIEEKMKHEKQKMRDKEKEMKQRQRKEIYALNKVMTEFENQNFQNFIKTHGLNTPSKQRKKNK